MRITQGLATYWRARNRGFRISVTGTVAMGLCFGISLLGEMWGYFYLRLFGTVTMAAAAAKRQRNYCC